MRGESRSSKSSKACRDFRVNGAERGIPCLASRPGTSAAAAPGAPRAGRPPTTAATYGPPPPAATVTGARPQARRGCASRRLTPCR